ncbi:MAG: RNA ligase (ATP), partial [Candidatus Altiarchaeales archaeon]|nr:RNA ligase (ATP) [Candidatus Altiarchaeales archaeon]
MAGFSVTIEKIEVIQHHNADRLEIALVGDYRSVVLKGQFKTGDLVAYIPEQAIVPDPLLQELGLKGRLAGKDKNRVKAIKLRGVLSQGICYAAREGWVEGQDVTEELGVTKYVPPVPTHMSGAAFGAGKDRCVSYDIENFKRYPDIFKEGEPVTFTEKIHGTFAQFGLLPPMMAHREHGRIMIASKGLADKGIAFQLNSPENENNLYIRAFNKYPKLRAAVEASNKDTEPVSRWINAGTPVFILGEVFG